MLGTTTPFPLIASRKVMLSQNACTSPYNIVQDNWAELFPFIHLSQSTSYRVTMHETHLFLMVGRQARLPNMGPTADIEEFIQSTRSICISTTEQIDRCRRTVHCLHPRCSNKDNKWIQTTLQHRRTRSQGISVVRIIGGMLPTIIGVLGVSVHLSYPPNAYL